MVEFQNFLNLILQAIAPIAASVITATLVILAKQFLVKLRTELGASQYALLTDLVRTGVLYAEQSGLTGAIENAGAEKKSEAMNYVVRNLDAYGLNHIDAHEISRLIEAAVADTFGREKAGIYAFLDNETEEVISSPDEEK
jgi:hypothetical protein